MSERYLLISHRTGIPFSELVELIMSYKMVLNYRDKYVVVKISSIQPCPKTHEKLTNTDTFSV